MKKLVFSSLAMLLAIATVAQNRVTISQQGSAGNQATVTQSGQGNRVIINQSSTDSSNIRQNGNRVSLWVDTNAQTTISQHSDGPNSVELMQDGQASTIIHQSSGTDNHTVTVFPGQKPVTNEPRPSKRRQRRQ